MSEIPIQNQIEFQRVAKAIVEVHKGGEDSVITFDLDDPEQIRIKIGTAQLLLKNNGTWKLPRKPSDLNLKF